MDTSETQIQIGKQLDRLTTRQLGKRRPTGPLAEPRETGPLDAGLGPPWVIELYIQDTPITVRMHIEHEIVLGRSDVPSGMIPGLDLTSYGGVEKGVSRRHAAIRAEASRLLIVDLNSTNGTRVNGYRLQPEIPYRLRHGDDIELGHVRIQVALSVVPVHESVAQEHPEVRLRPQPVPGNGQRVLVVVDDRDVADVFRLMLENAGYDVIVVHGVASAIREINSRMPDMIVLDLALPDLHGLELCRYVRRAMHVRHVPIAVVSGSTDSEHVKKALEAGADVFLGKPVGIDELIRAVSSLVANPAV